MGRRNKKAVKLQRSLHARLFLMNDEKAPDLSKLSPDKKRLEIAHYSSLILSSPEIHHAKLKSLLEVASDPDSYISALAITSLCAVFIDILPGYHIRLIKEETTSLSKEVRAQRMFEGMLLAYYQDYLKLLKEKAKKNLGAIRCMCRLLNALPHFNFRERLLISLSLKVAQYPDIVLPCFKEVILGNELELRLMCIKSINKLLGIQSYKHMPTELIEVLAQLDLSYLEAPIQENKRSRDEVDLEKEILEAEESLTPQNRAKFNLNTLREIVAIYFKIIKDCPKSHLFPSVLRGVGKYASILNVELVKDLIKTLLDMLSSGELVGESRLQCIQTCLMISNSSGNRIKVEDRDLTMTLYDSLLFLPTSLKEQTVLVNCLSTYFLDRKQFSYEVVAAFIKRLLSVAFHSDVDMLKALVCIVKKMAQKYPRTCGLFDSDDYEEEQDMYLPEVDDPHLANASSSSVVNEMKALLSIKDNELQTLLKGLLNFNAGDIREPTHYLSSKPIKF